MPVISLGLRPGQIPIEITPTGPVPDQPKLVTNELVAPSGNITDWTFRGMVEYPSGRKKYFAMLIPPGSRDSVIAVLTSETFWEGFWHQFTTDMINSGELVP